MSDISPLIQKKLQEIHNIIYSRIYQGMIDVFLCGGADSQVHVRDMVRKHVSKYKFIRTLYPEELFIDYLNRNKDSNMLELENFLADNCDCICIICESPGSLVELGAFSNHAKISKKIIVAIEEKYKRKKSFIILGPVKLIKMNNSKDVIYYSKENINELNETLIKTLFNKLNKGGFQANKNLNTFIGLYYFIPLLLYFFTSISSENLMSYLKYLYNIYNYDIDKLEIYFNMSLKLLYKDKLIESSVQEGKRTYKLTNNGYKYLNEKILKTLNINDKTKLYDYIRFGIMKDKYYHCSS